MKLTKKQQTWQNLDADKVYSLADAIEVLREYASKKFDETLEIAAVSVHPSARGKGLGKALISKGAEEVLKRNKTPSLTTKETNLAMRLCAEGIGMKLKD